MRGKKLGWCGYATVYRMLLDRPWIAMDMAEQLGVTRQTAGRVLDRLCDVGFAHRCEWVSPKPHCKTVALYAAGEGVDSPHPPHHKGRVRAKHNSLPELLAVARILVLLRSPITKADLAEQTGAAAGNLRRLLDHCRDIGLVRIAEWDNDKPGVPAAMFCIGEGPDAPRPRPKPRSEINRLNRLGRIAKQQQMAVLRAITCAHSRVLEAA